MMKLMRKLMMKVMKACSACVVANTVIRTEARVTSALLFPPMWPLGAFSPSLGGA